jgi:protein TonB
MSYLDRTADPNRRTAAIVGVIAVHALIGYGLVTGLAARFRPPVHRTIDGYSVPLPTPTPPPPPPTPQPSATATPQGPIALPQPFPTDAPTFPPPNPIPFPDPIPTAVPSAQPPLPPAHPAAVKPRPAVPKNDPKTWVTTDDYPSRDLREGNEGTARFRVTVGTNGRVVACEIVRSSGHRGLDEATCRAVKARARFVPAKDGNDEAVAGEYSNNVLWRIPR